MATQALCDLIILSVPCLTSSLSTSLDFPLFQITGLCAGPWTFHPVPASGPLHVLFSCPEMLFLLISSWMAHLHSNVPSYQGLFWSPSLKLLLLSWSLCPPSCLFFLNYTYNHQSSIYFILFYLSCVVPTRMQVSQEQQFLFLFFTLTFIFLVPIYGLQYSWSTRNISWINTWSFHISMRLARQVFLFLFNGGRGGGE